MISDPYFNPENWTRKKEKLMLPETLVKEIEKLDFEQLEELADVVDIAIEKLEEDEEEEEVEDEDEDEDEEDEEVEDEEEEDETPTPPVEINTDDI